MFHRWHCSLEKPHEFQAWGKVDIIEHINLFNENICKGREIVLKPMNCMSLQIKWNWILRSPNFGTHCQNGFDKNNENWLLKSSYSKNKSNHIFSATQLFNTEYERWGDGTREKASQQADINFQLNMRHKRHSTVRVVERLHRIKIAFRIHCTITRQKLTHYCDYAFNWLIEKMNECTIVFHCQQFIYWVFSIALEKRKKSCTW